MTEQTCLLYSFSSFLNLLITVPKAKPALDTRLPNVEGLGGGGAEQLRVLLA